MKFKIAHSLPWRTRIRTFSLRKKSKTVRREIEHQLGELNGIVRVDVQPCTGSVILEHPGGPVAMGEVFEIIKKALCQSLQEANCSSKNEQTRLQDEKSSLCGRCRTANNLKKSGAKNHVSGLTLVASGLYLLFLWVKKFFSPAAVSASPSIIGRITSLPALVALGLSLPIQRQALENLKRNGRPDIGLLSTGLLYLSILLGNAATALVVFWLFNLSGWLESRITKQTRTAIRSMLQQKETHVWLVRDGVETQVPVTELATDDIISLRHGNSIPADGTVTKGKALVNEASMTGEDFPVYRNKGDHVLAGTVIEEGEIWVRVVSAGEQTRLAAIIRLIEKAEDSSSPLQVSSQRFSEAIVPISLSLAFGTFIVTGNLLRAMAVLIITCPCAIRLSTSVAMSAAMGNGAGRGILIKEGRYLELCGRINVLVLDKTGTLTDPVPEVAEVVVLDHRFKSETILQLAASTQKFWQHPMGRAVIENARVQGLADIPCEKTELVVGQGVRARIQSHDFLLGSRLFMENHHVNTAQTDLHEQRMHGRGEHILHVARAGKLIGLIGIKSRLRGNIQLTMEKLRSMDIRRLVMLTGDGEQGAKATAARLDLDEFHWNQSPEDKAAWISSWKKDHPDDVVAMVGDGINDTPAFACADLSFAMGEGSADAAVEYADIVLQRDDPALVAEAVEIGQKTVSVIHQDYTMAIGLNSAGLIFTTFGVISPFAGAFFHNVITMIVVANSGKLLTYKTAHGITEERSGQT